jgi:hypothetical protein
MSEFTKGEWEVQDTGPCETSLRYLVAEKRADGDLEYLAWCYDPKIAHLIASAPAMHEFIQSLHKDEMPGYMWDLRNKTLAQAKGESK